MKEYDKIIEALLIASVIDAVKKGAVILAMTVIILSLAGCAVNDQKYPCNDQQKALDTIKQMYAISQGYAVYGGCQ